MFRFFSISIWIVFAGLPLLSSIGQVSTFPGAEGWAAETPGGRGGTVLKVSNLNPTGEGSLRAALEAEGSRIVVFDVGGTIDLEGSTLTIENPFLTVAGHSAPYPGITIIDGSIEIRGTSDIVLQHLRVRPGAARHSEEVGVWEPDGITVNFSSRVIIDHCSVSWAVDENLTVTGPRFDGQNVEEWRAATSSNVTFSNNIVAEALSVSTHAEGEHSKGSLVHDNTQNIAILKSLYANNVARNPIVKAGSASVIMNNVISNPGTLAMHYSAVAEEWAEALAVIAMPPVAQTSVVGNILNWGPAQMEGANPVPLFVAIDEFAGIPELAGSVFFNVFFEDNLRFDHTGVMQEMIPELTDPFGDPVPQYIVEERPVWNPSLHQLPAEDLAAYILENAGARPWESDPVDQRIKSGWQNGTGAIVHFETDVGGFPDLPSTVRGPEWDTDDDGMPDTWEVLNGTNPEVADSGGYDVDPAYDPESGIGYTNLEMYLNEVGSLRISSTPSIEIAETEAGYELLWASIPSDGELQHSTNMTDWELLAEGSVSGKKGFTIDEVAGRIFLRWAKVN